MKKIMWIVAVLPVVVASMMLQVIPDMIPHKIGIFIFPIVILCVTFFWHLLIGTFEKKTVKANTDKERMEANSSARVLCVVGLSQAIMFGIMNYCILYSSCVQENVNGSKVTAAQGVDLSILAWALAMGTDIGGSATPIGASANVVGIATAAKAGHMIKWGKYCKVMAPATIIVIVISMVMIYARYL